MFTWFRKLFYEGRFKFDDISFKCLVDVDGMTKELDLNRLAIEAAENELPRSDATSPDDKERKIHTYIYERLTDLTNLANKKLVHYNTAISDTDLNHELARIKNITEQSSLKIKTLVTEAKEELRTLQDKKIQLAKELEEFKDTNKLDRDPTYPDSNLFNYSVVISVLVVEAGLNSYFFAKGLELGLLGGFSQSIIVAAMNISLGLFVAGMILLRYISHVSFLYRLFSWVGLLLYIILIISFNLLIAHYRDLLETNPEQAITLAWSQFKSTPLELAGLDSVLLFMVGIIVSSIAAYEGRTIDDLYPGYGSLHRRLLDVQSIYTEECKSLSDKIESYRSAYIDELEDLRHQVNDNYQHLFNLVQLKKALIEQYKNCVANYFSAGDTLIHKYRNINQMNRSTPPPKYFQSSWKPNREFELTGTNDDSEKLDNQMKLYNEFPEYVRSRFNDIEIIYSKSIETLRTIEPGISKAKTMTGS